MSGLYGCLRGAAIIAYAGVVALASLHSVRADDAKSELCVLVPHFKDEYWLSVGYGVEQQASREGADIIFYEAGGYNSVAKQILQIDRCIALQPKAILIGAVSSNHPDLIAALKRAEEIMPVYGLVNELHAPALAGMIGVDWEQMGSKLGRYLQANSLGKKSEMAVLVSGPAKAGWTGPLEKGLRSALKNSPIAIAAVYGADTGLSQQLALVRQALQEYPNADYLIGSAPAIEAAMGLRAARPDLPQPALAATYISHTVLRGVVNGSVIAVAFDDPIEQGRLAVKLALTKRNIKKNLAENLQFIGPEVKVITRISRPDNVRLVSPSNYFPYIQ
ncbi:TMAO reductase system periplasmic protein TorT [Polycladidibacter hongkongensis]|uniref:TMAO reductase system periplasmic protein TorT n=1 Tax=Polycladidibacter hongkongensis TaxID=1647556 RepID=UPI0008296635|nr:TMAO reductase system periplasmic protein TorT [Pseudovibrio hongkongensis]